MPPDVLIDTLTAALQQHKLITAERELLEQTLSGSIRVLCDMLSFANPEAFGRSSRITRSVQAIADLLQLPDPWLTTTAAMLSQIGCVILPEIVLDKVYRGETDRGKSRSCINSIPSWARISWPQSPHETRCGDHPVSGQALSCGGRVSRSA